METVRDVRSTLLKCWERIGISGVTGVSRMRLIQQLTTRHLCNVPIQVGIRPTAATSQVDNDKQHSPLQ